MRTRLHHHLSPRTIGIWAAAVAAAALVASVPADAQSPDTSTPKSAVAPTGAAPTTQTLATRDLSNDQTFDGVIGAASSRSFYAQTAGTITAIKKPGSPLRQGDTVFATDNVPTVYFEGTMPAWRELGWSATNGLDLLQLENGLASAGYDPNNEMIADGTFDGATYNAVVRMQTALGLAITGTVTLGQVVFAPPGVAGLPELSVGALTSVGRAVTSSESTNLQATVTVPASVNVQIAIGQSVSVTLPDYSTTTGQVASIGTVTDATTATTSVVASVAVDRPKDTKDHGIVDQAPIKVRVTQMLARAALVVPAGAIAAHVDGTSTVLVPADGGNTTVAFVPGVAAGGFVVVASGDLRPGMKVTIPGFA